MVGTPATQGQRLPHWRDCTDEQRELLRAHKRSEARRYHRERPLRGLKAEDRRHELVTARRIELEPDLRRATGRADYFDAFETSAFVYELDVSQHTVNDSGGTKRERFEALVRAIGATSRGDSMTAAPGHKWLAERLNVSRSTLTRYIRELEAEGFLVPLSAGRSAGVLGTNGEALRAVYLLVVPRNPTRRRTEFEDRGTPAGESTAVSATDESAGAVPNAPQATAAVEKPATPSRSHLREIELPIAREGSSDREPPSGSRRARRNERLRFVHEVTSAVPALKELDGLTPQGIAAVLRPFHEAGWSVDDIRYAVLWEQDGSPRRYCGTLGVTKPWHWFRYTMSRWLAGDGAPAPSPSVRRAERHAAAREASRTERARVRRHAREFAGIAAAGFASEGYARLQQLRVDLARGQVGVAR